MIRHIKLIGLLTSLLVITFFTGSHAYFDNTVGARGEGIGFSFSTLSEEPFGALYNPAGPAFVKGWQTQFQFYKPTTYGLPSIDELPYGGLTGINYYNRKYGNIVFNAHQYGSFADPTYVTTTNSLNFSFARLLSENFSTGISAKYIFETNRSERSTYDFDLGVKWRSPYNISLSASGENFLRSEFESDTEVSRYLPRKFRFSGAYHIPMANNSGTILAGWQLEQSGFSITENTSLFNFGSEWWVGTHNSISLGLRAGYTTGKTTTKYNTVIDFNRWSAGFSLNFDLKGRDLRIDYAVRSYPFETSTSLVADNLLSFTYGWGGVPNYYSGLKEDEKYDLTKYQQRQPFPDLVEVMPPPFIGPENITETPADEQIRELPPITLKTDEPVQEQTKLEEKTGEMVETPAFPAITWPPFSVPSPDGEAGESESLEEEKLVVEELTVPEPLIEPSIDEPVVLGEEAELESPPIAQAPITPIEEPTIQIEEVEEITEIAEPEPIKIAPEPVEPYEYKKLNLTLDYTMLNVGYNSRLVFFLRPEGIVRLRSWNLYIFRSKLKKWSETAADNFAIHSVKGKGITPLSVVWDGVLKNGGYLSPGKYYFIVTGFDKYGQGYKSKWHKIKVK